MEEENKINILMALEESYEILLQGIVECDLSGGMRYLDIGASGHMTREVDPIFYLNEAYKGGVRFGDGSRISIKGRGKIILNFNDYTHFPIKNVLYTPSLKANIVSHGRLDKEGYDIHMYKNFLTIYDKRGILLTKVK